MDMEVDVPVRSSSATTPVEEALPSEFSTAAQGYGLEISKDKLTVRYVAEGRHSNDVGAIQANRPVPSLRLIYYYEITVLDQGDKSFIAIGFADKTFKLTRQPGWEPNSYGYHGDDGRKYCVLTEGQGVEYGPPFGTGDTVGAGIHLGKQEMFFTKNGVKLKTAFSSVRGSLLYPTVGLHSKNEAIEANFGQRPFKFDLEGMLAEERSAHLASVDKLEVDRDIPSRVVRQYLLHFGYAGTLAAFDAATGGEGASSGRGPATASAVGTADGLCSRDGGNVAMNGGTSAPAETSGRDAEESKLELRSEVRLRLLAGDVDGALQLLKERCGLLLQPRSGWRDVVFALHCQKYIELLREERILDALSFAHNELNAYTSAASRQYVTQLEADLQAVFALISYTDPSTSPLGHLFSIQRRDVVADLVNNAMLCIAAGHGPEHRPVCLLERLMKQVVVLHAALHEQNGGQGESFQLAHLLPPAPHNT